MYSFTQLYVTFCDSVDCSPPGSSVNEIFQARILEWVAISYSKRSSWHGDLTWISCIAVIVFTHWARGKPLRVSMHGDYQWCSWWMPHHCPLWTLGAWKPSQPSLPPALVLFNYTFPAEGESQCFLLSENQSSCIIFLHIAKSSFGHCICYIRRKGLGPGKTITRNNSCYLLFSCILIWIHLYWAPLPSHWTEKKREKGQNL